jgi:hypothetical protein
MTFPGTSIRPADLTKLLLHELDGVQCRCASAKQKGQTFCRKCYYTLPAEMRATLYQRVGKGYEQAYVASVNLLAHQGRMQRPEWLTEAEAKQP